MKIVKEFSRFAHEYTKHNIIQLEVANKLTSMLEKKKYNKIVDMGAGDGAIYNSLVRENITVNHFFALDFSVEMLNLHPHDINVIKKRFDFNNIESFKRYSKNQFDVLISSSALQWSDNIELTLEAVSTLASQHYFSFFTANTFATLHKTAGINSPIHTREKIEEALSKYYNYELELCRYRLNFNSVLEMFRYIKKSGVSGGEFRLNYREMKRLMASYPLSYLEFEVIFVKAVAR